MMDLDGDGFLTKAEIKECIFKNCFEVSEEIVNSLIYDADINEDNRVSYNGKGKQIDTFDPCHS